MFGKKENEKSGEKEKAYDEEDGIGSLGTNGGVDGVLDLPGEDVLV